MRIALDCHGSLMVHWRKRCHRVHEEPLCDADSLYEMVRKDLLVLFNLVKYKKQMFSGYEPQITISIWIAPTNLGVHISVGVGSGWGMPLLQIKQENLFFHFAYLN